MSLGLYFVRVQLAYQQALMGTSILQECLQATPKHSAEQHGSCCKYRRPPHTARMMAALPDTHTWPLWQRG